MSAETDKLVGAAASQALPGIFQQGFQRRYPGFITTQGRGNGYYNAMYEMEQRQFNAARMTAAAADAEQASRTIVGMFMTAAKLSGKELSDEQIVKIQESARFHGSNIETYIALARGMGLSEGAINYIRQAFYGDKGSTTHLFDTSYNALRSRIGSGAALRQAQQLATYQFGAGWNRAMTYGLNADEYAATQQFMIENGGMAGTNLASGDGHALIDYGMIDSYASRHHNSTVKDLMDGTYNEMFRSGPDAQRNQQAVKMAANAYINELKKMDYDQLRKYMKGRITSSVDSAWDKLDTLDKNMKKIKEGYRLKVDTNEKDVNKAIKDLQNQLKENIKKATKANDEEAVNQLKKYGDEVIDNIKDIYRTGIKDAGGKEVSSFEIDRQARTKVSNIAYKQIEDVNQIYVEMQAKLRADKKALASKELAGEENDAESKQLRANIELTERQIAELRQDPAYKHVRRLYGSTDADARQAAVGNLAKQLQAAMAASGKPISVQDALAASKSLMPMSASTEDLLAMSEHLAKKIGGVIDRNGSPEQFLLQMASGRNIAAQYGLKGLEGNLAAGIGTSSNKYSSQYGLTDKQAQGIADEMTDSAAENARTGRQAVILAGMVAKSGNYTAEDRKKSFFGKLEQQVKAGKITQEEYKRLRDLSAKVEKNPTEVTKDDGEFIEQMLKTAGMVNESAFEAGSSMSNAAIRGSKEIYESVVGSVAAQNRRLESSGTNSALAHIFTEDGGEAKAIQLDKLMLKDSDEYRTIMEKGLTDPEAAKIDYIALLDKHLKRGTIDRGTYDRLKKEVQENGLNNIREVWDNAYSDTDELNKQKVMLESDENRERDAKMETISAMGKELFSATDKNAFSKVMDIVGSEAYRNADDKTKAKMISEAFGSELSPKQKEFLAFNMVRTGKLSTGMEYKNRAGETGYLSDEQINVAKYALEHPAELKEKLIAVGPNGMIEIDGEKYTRDEINEYISDVESAAGKAVGMEGTREGEFFTEDEKTGEYVSTNKFSKITQEGYLTNDEVEAEKRKQIESRIKEVSGWTKDQGYKNVHYNALAAAKTEEEKAKEMKAMVDAVMKDPSKAAELGIDVESYSARKNRIEANKKRRKETESWWFKPGEDQYYNVNDLKQELFDWDKEGKEKKEKAEEEKNRKIDEKFLTGQETTNEILGQIRDKL